MLGFTFFKVSDDRMSPKIPNESYILVSDWFLSFYLAEGKQILIRHHTDGIIMKTVALVDHHGFIWVKGDNENDTSVEEMGPIGKEQVIGLVFSILKKNRKAKII